MSKQGRQDNQPQKSPAAKTPEVAVYRRCPLCWSGNGGYGVAYSTQGLTRYYRCCKATGENGPCGHTWSATIHPQTMEVVKVEHREVRIDGER